MTTAFQADAFQTSPLAFQIDVDRGGIVGRKRRTAQQELDARIKRDEEEVMAILAAVMPLVADGETEEQTIKLGEGDDIQYH